MIFRLDRFIINSGNTITATANVRIAHEGKSREEVAVGDGPMDAAFNAVEKIIGTSFQLEDYSVHSVGGGKDAQGEVVVKIRKDDQVATGRGLSTDVVEAGILAFINAANRMFAGLCTAGRKRGHVMSRQIAVFDSTLRDGAQGESISFSVGDKLKIVEMLDDLGVRYIEAGNPGSNPKDLEFFRPG